MTGQIPDIFLYNESEYDIVGIEGGELFNPSEYGFNPRPNSTACWRGFQLFFSIDDKKRLILDKMYINQKERKIFQGKKPKRVRKPEGITFPYHYFNLQFQLNYSGSILIAKDFINEYYIHMGFQSPRSYKIVFELTFKDGLLISEKDLSEQMEKDRSSEQNLPQRPSVSASEEEITSWIKETFDLDYKKE